MSSSWAQKLSTAACWRNTLPGETTQWKLSVEARPETEMDVVTCTAGLARGKERSFVGKEYRFGVSPGFRSCTSPFLVLLRPP